MLWPVVFSILKKDYISKNGEIKTLDFRRDPKTQEEYINNKVAEVTNGMIDHIVEGLDDSTLSVIISGKSFSWNPNISKNQSILSGLNLIMFDLN